MMSDLLVNGGGKLEGRVRPSGNKNAVLPIICASLLTDEPVTLRNVPDITDLNKLVELLRSLGSEISWDKDNQVMEILNKDINLDEFEGSLPMGFRGAILVFGPLTARVGEFNVTPKVGGCALGIREIDTHLDVIEAVGADVNYSDDAVSLKINERFDGGNFWADYMSVTTTENFIMSAVTAKGTSVMKNAASEPHVQDLCKFLISMGAEIDGVGSSCLRIKGVENLKSTDYTIIPDHHEITTFLALGAMTGGRVEVEDVREDHFGLIVNTFDKLGVKIKFEGDVAIVEEGQELRVQETYTSNLIPKVEVAPWPYFPSDLEPLMMALATKTEGQVMFWNKIYDGAHRWIQELSKFGVKLLPCDPHRALIWGGLDLKPATVQAPDIIRATVALFMVAQSINGQSVIKDANPIRRAHPHFVKKMHSLGADIKWLH
jgi:UDP-N-acetylglucosamine 1-carboxyvinyltransferase